MSTIAPEIISEIIEFGESDAWANYYQNAPVEFRKKYRVEAKKIGSVWVTMIPELDWTFYNRIVGLGIGHIATEALLDDCIGVLENAGCKNYIVQISPFAQPAHLLEWIKKRNLLRGRCWSKFYRQTEPAPQVATDLRLESLDEKHKDAFADIVSAAFGMPPEFRPLINGIVGKPGWHNYLAYDVKLPVAAAAMFITGEVAWLGFDSTLESHRKRGAQGAMFARRVADGLTLGAKWFVTETGEDTPASPNPSYHNMIRTGFNLAYMRPNYIHEAPID